MLSLFPFFYSPRIAEKPLPVNDSTRKGWDKSPGLSIVFRLSSKTQWLSGLYYADFISFTALLNCVEVGRRNQILTNYKFRPTLFLFIQLRALL